MRFEAGAPGAESDGVGKSPNDSPTPLTIAIVRGQRPVEHPCGNQQYATEPGAAALPNIAGRIETAKELPDRPRHAHGRTAVFGWYDNNIFGAVERVGITRPFPTATSRDSDIGAYWQSGILATGAEERPLVFGGNDRPGVMLSTAARGYVNRYAAAPGEPVSSSFRPNNDFSATEPPGI